MYEANLLRNCGTGNSSCSAGGTHDVLVFAIGIGAISSTPNASFDKHAQVSAVAHCECKRHIEYGNKHLGNHGFRLHKSSDSAEYSATTTPMRIFGMVGSRRLYVIDATQEKGKVYIVDTNGNVPAQLQQVFNEIAALLKLRLTL